ncbi:MAG: DoxX-like family protein, partial [Azovibrio sp.]
YPIQDSLALLAPFGITGSVALAVLASATLLDLGMGILTLRRPGRCLWLVQLALITAYTLLIAWKLPEFLLHPFGPVLKNLAIVTLLLQLLAEEKAP